jgi:hypothetical protein
MITNIKRKLHYEMFKRSVSQGEEEGTFYVLHIIPLIFFPSFYSYDAE